MFSSLFTYRAEQVMFRNNMSLAKKLLVSRHLPFITPAQECFSGSTAVCDFQNSSLQGKNSCRLVTASFSQQSHTLTSPSDLQSKNPLFSFNCVTGTRMASSSFYIPNPSEVACNLVNMAKCIDLNDLKAAPQPMFWVTFTSSAAQLGIPLLELVSGYSPVMTYLQLYIAAAHLAWSGGEKWGLALSGSAKYPLNWDTMNKALVPTGFSVFSLLLPYPLGFLVATAGLVTSLYGDLKSCHYPRWAISCKFLVALSSTVGLCLALIAYVLFHNRESNKTKELPPPNTEENNATQSDEK